MITETGARARTADLVGRVRTSDGLTLPWEVHGDGPTTIVFLPANPISHSRLWKAQIHYLARRHRVVVYDGRGNGDADLPDASGLWDGAWRADDCVAVLDATETERAVLVGICGDGVWPSLQVADAHPERVLGIVAIGTGVHHLAPAPAHRRPALAAVRRRRRRPAGLAEAEPSLHPRRPPRLPRVLLPRDVPGAPFGEAHRGRGRVRARRPGRRLPDGRDRHRDEGRGGGADPPGAMPVARRPRRPGQLPGRRTRTSR